MRRIAIVFALLLALPSDASEPAHPDLMSVQRMVPQVPALPDSAVIVNVMDEDVCPHGVQPALHWDPEEHARRYRKILAECTWTLGGSIIITMRSDSLGDRSETDVLPLARAIARDSGVPGLQLQKVMKADGGEIFLYRAYFRRDSLPENAFEFK